MAEEQKKNAEQPPMAVYVGGMFKIDDVVLKHGILVLHDDMGPLHLTFEFQGDQLVYKLENLQVKYPDTPFVFKNARQQPQSPIIQPKHGLIIPE